MSEEVEKRKPFPGEHKHKLIHYWSTAYGDFPKDIWVCYGCHGIFNKKVEFVEEG